MLAVAEDLISKSLHVSPMQMFLMPSLITMSIAATRMYRTLADFILHTDMYGTVSFHYPQGLITVGIAVAEMVRKPPRRLIA